MQERVAGQTRCISQLANVVGPLGAAAACRAAWFTAAAAISARERQLFGLLLHEAPRAFGCVPRAPTPACQARGASRSPVSDAATATCSTTATAAPRPPVMQTRCLLILVIAALCLDLRGTEPKRNSADTYVVIARSEPHSWGFTMVPFHLAGDLARAADARVRAAAVASGSRSAAAHDFEVGSHFGGFVLGDEARIFQLSTVAPDRGLLLAKKCDIAGGLYAGGATRAARGRASQVGAG